MDPRFLDPGSDRPTLELAEAVSEVIRENAIFLRKEMTEVFRQVIDFANGSVERLDLVLKHPNREQELFRRAMFYFLLHVQMPGAYAILVDALSGNLPAAFREARFILESLVKCYFADLRHPEKGSFVERIRALEKERKSIAKWMREADQEMGTGEQFESLWRKLSEEWAG